MVKVLIIDDEEKLRSLLKRILSLEGYVVSESGNLKEGIKQAEKENPDIILCDVKLPDGNGVEFVPVFRNKFPDTEIILLTAYGNVTDGVQAMKSGAFDYITKGDDNEKLIPLLQKVVEKLSLSARLQSLEKKIRKQYGFDQVFGHSENIKEAISMARQVAVTDTTVLLLGETGTGKEVFAQAIHQESPRNQKPFLALNCSAFGKDILESEIFGHKAGAFTGAMKDKKGLVEEANGGTLFLDEIGEMPAGLQSKLLRFLETNEFIKVGDTRATKVDVRVIAATNRNLQQEIKTGNFREDLYYRINVFSITLPALRERKEDIPVLAGYFLKIFSAKTNKRISQIQPACMEILKNYNWPGNIRELKNTIERAVILTHGDELLPSSLPMELQINIPAQTGLAEFELATAEQLHIRKVLLHTHGNKTEAARLLNIGLTTLYRKIEEYGI